MAHVEREDVRQFWEEEACGERYGEEQDHLRYELEPEILHFADFGSAAGMRVLEIGVGMGSDFLRWARAGAMATGVDITERAVRITRQRMANENLEGLVQIADAERLPFADGQFDIVYSWGVLHHTPNPPLALAEAQRVLAPGGQLKLMLYHRRSWVALAAWVRFSLLRGKPFQTLGQAIANIESPGTKAFTAAEVRTMLGSSGVVVTPILTTWDRKWAPIISRLCGSRFGWFLLINSTQSQTRKAPPAMIARHRAEDLKRALPSNLTNETTHSRHGRTRSPLWVQSARTIRILVSITLSLHI